MKSTIVSIGMFEIRWYSLLILISFFIGFYIVYNNREKINLNKNEVIDMLFYLILISLIGARIYYVIFNLDYYLLYPQEIFMIWNGGLAIHGGIIFGFIYLYFYCKKKSINILKLISIIIPALLIGQIIGRWGNFFNQEAYGPITTYKTLKNLHIPSFIIDGMYIDKHYYHPTFLYESIFCLIILLIVFIIKKVNSKKEGLIVSTYLILYATERFFIESLRQDSLMLMNIKIAQIVCIIMFIIGIIIFIKEVLYDK